MRHHGLNHHRLLWVEVLHVHDNVLGVHWNLTIAVRGINTRRLKRRNDSIPVDRSLRQ